MENLFLDNRAFKLIPNWFSSEYWVIELEKGTDKWNQQLQKLLQ